MCNESDATRNQAKPYDNGRQIGQEKPYSSDDQLSLSDSDIDNIHDLSENHSVDEGVDEDIEIENDDDSEGDEFEVDEIDDDIDENDNNDIESEEFEADEVNDDHENDDNEIENDDDDPD